MRLAAALLAAALSLAGCNGSHRKPISGSPAAVTFQDVTERSGVTFRHRNGATGRKLLPETMGSGLALFDADGDGLLDVLFVDATSWPGEGPPGRARLYLNRGDLRFEDVSEQWGLPTGLYGMGAAVADYDADGHPDVLITALGNSRLLRNDGGRQFVDVTRSTGLHTPGWPTSAAWLDADRDGQLDLFICHYVRWSIATDIPFSLDGKRRSYSRPDAYPGEPCQLLLQRGGRFVDVSRAAGIAGPLSKALGVALLDFDGDGWTDIAVANDMVPNLLFHNQGRQPGGGTLFKEVAVQAGMAVAEGGTARAGMGIDAGDYENLGRDAILITNFSGEQLSLFRRDASGLFRDVAARAGVGTPSQRYLGFGAFFMDADLDGWLDILVANGHIQDDVGIRSSGVTYAQPALLFLGSPDGRFRMAGPEAGDLSLPRVARGAARGDLDNDGDEDVVLTTCGGAPAVLEAVGTPRASWLRLRLQGSGGNRDAIGAVVRVRAGRREQFRMVRSGSSYLSHSDTRLVFGLGSARQVDEIEVRWPNGEVESFGAARVNGEEHLVQGQGSG
jgi:hypothetical protein